MSLNSKLEEEENGFNPTVIQGIALTAPEDMFEKIHYYLRSNYPDAYEINKISCTGNSRPYSRSIVFEMIGRLPQEEVNELGEFVQAHFPELYEGKLKRYYEIKDLPRMTAARKEEPDKRTCLYFERDF